MSTFFSVSVFRSDSMCESGFCPFPPSACDDRVSDGKTLQTHSIMGRCCHSSKRVVCTVARDCGNCSQSGCGTLRDRRMTAAAPAFTIPPLFPPLLTLFCSACITSACCHISLISPLSSTCASRCLTNFSSHHANSSLLSRSPQLSTSLLLVYSPEASGCQSPPSEPLTKLLENRQSGAAGALCAFARGASVAENIYQTWMFSHTNTVTHAFERVCIFAHLRTA